MRVWSGWREAIGKLIPIGALLWLLRPKATKCGMTRIGLAADGGYLLPADLQGIDAVFSPGVGDSSHFEFHFAQLGIPCHMVDGSVDSPPTVHPLFDFQKKWLAQATSHDAISLNDWIDAKAPGKRNLLLQMDIENAEWAVLASVNSRLLRKFRILVIEFHLLSNKFAKSHQRLDLFRVLWKIRKTHVPVHFHANNCCGSVGVGKWRIPQVAEVTFINRNRNNVTRDFARLPHLLDHPNSTKPHLASPWD